MLSMLTAFRNAPAAPPAAAASRAELTTGVCEGKKHSPLGYDIAVKPRRGSLL